MIENYHPTLGQGIYLRTIFSLFIRHSIETWKEMSPLFYVTTLVLILVGGALGHPLHNRDVDCSNSITSTTVKLICQSLWYLEGTIAHCPNGTACNQTALTEIKSAIQSNLCLWVRLLEIISNDRRLCNSWSVQVAQQCPTLIPSTSSCSNMALEDICGSIYVQLLWNFMCRDFGIKFIRA